MILSSRKYYINSADRISGTNQNFTIPIEIPTDSGFDSIAVIDCSIPLSYYVIDAPYNQFTLTEGASSVDVTIPSGNYNVPNFQSALTTLLDSSSPNGYIYSMTFNAVTAKYTYLVSGNSGVQPQFIFSDFLVSQMGFPNHTTNSFVGNTLLSTDVISFVATQALFIRCDLISDASNTLQTNFANNAIPYSYIPYTCQNIEHYAKKLSTTNHSTITLSLVDALGQEINLNRNDWLVNIMLFKKNDMAEMFKSFLNFISVSTGIGAKQK
jgi:hypothetical protein